MSTPFAEAPAGAGLAGNSQEARRALRGFDAGVAIFLGGVAAITVTDVVVIWFFHRLRGAVDRYGWGNVPVEEIPPFEFFDRWGLAIDWAAVAIYGVGFLVAMWSARRLAEAVGIRSWEYRWVWTVVTIFIPIACLFRPWLGFAEIRRAIFACVATGRPSRGEGFSAFTLILGLVTFVCWGIIKVASAAADQVAEPSSAAEFYSHVDRATHLLLTIAAAQGGLLATLLAYLLTLRRKAGLLANRIDLDAFD